MKSICMTGQSAGRIATFVVLTIGLALPLAAQSQDFASAPRSIYVDGSTPVDPRTRSRVDAYFEQIENIERAKVEEQERFQRFIYHDNIFGPQQSGRF